ncbi:MAG: glycosyl hydrolase family 28-related protein [Candidatus Sumerlaeota bacterium]|nr:glycosyl hydrolase family 28-related protein [Candidatus Sumerlaeota bacterium]
MIWLAAMLLGIGAAGAAEPAPSPAGQWNVRDFGAKDDGQADDTAAFQAALDAAGVGGGGTVNAPLGQYRFNGSLKVPANVTLAGTWVGLRYFPGEGSEESHRGKVGAGTQFRVYGGRGQSEEGTPFLSLTNNSVLKGVVISYPEQGSDPEPTPYPWTLFGKGDGVSVIDVCLLRAYQGVKLQVAPCHLVRNLSGSPILTGLYIDMVHDIGRVENVHFKSGAGSSPEARLWAARHSQGFVIGSTDWQYMTNTFCSSARRTKAASASTTAPSGAGPTTSRASRAKAGSTSAIAPSGSGAAPRPLCRPSSPRAATSKCTTASSTGTRRSSLSARTPTAR